MFPSPEGPVSIYYRPFQEGADHSHALLRQAAARYAGCPALCLGPIEQGPWGKPFFSGAPQLQFSLTHSGRWWLCAFSAAPLGLDLQAHHSYLSPAKLSQRFFHPAEDAFLSRTGYLRFFDLWCAKESWVKFTGRGFFDDPSTFSVASPSGSFPVQEGAQLRLLPFSPGYSLCLCAATLGQIGFLSL